MGIDNTSKLFLGAELDIDLIDWNHLNELVKSKKGHDESSSDGLINETDSEDDQDKETDVVIQVELLNEWLSHFPQFKWMFFDYSYPYYDCERSLISVHLSYKLKHNYFLSNNKETKEENIKASSYENLTRLSLADLQDILSNRVNVETFHELLKILNHKRVDPKLYSVPHIF